MALVETLLVYVLLCACIILATLLLLKQFSNPAPKKDSSSPASVMLSPRRAAGSEKLRQRGGNAAGAISSRSPERVSTVGGRFMLSPGRESPLTPSREGRERGPVVVVELLQELMVALTSDESVDDLYGCAASPHKSPQSHRTPRCS